MSSGSDVFICVENGVVFLPFSRKQSEALRQARQRLAAMTPSELESENI